MWITIYKEESESLVILSVYLETKLAGRNGRMSLVYLCKPELVGFFAEKGEENMTMTKYDT